MDVVFYLSSAIAWAAAAAAITRTNAVHALLYLIVSFLAIALVFFSLGAPLAAAVQVIINAGAIMVLFLFVALILNQGPESEEQERAWYTLRAWAPPAGLSTVLLAEVIYLVTERSSTGEIVEVAPVDVGITMLGPYVLAVEVSALLLLAGIVGAFHVGRRIEEEASSE